MSVLPLLLSELLEENRPAALFDQNFGLGVLGDELLHCHPRTRTVPLLSGYYRPWRILASQNSGSSQLKSDKDGFRVNLDVQQFQPDEISVKVVDDFVVVEGKHEERQDEHGFISREFKRRYKIPSDINIEALASTLSSDGVLQIAAPKKELAATSGERVIPITQTQQPAVKHSQQGGGEAQEKMEQ